MADTPKTSNKLWAMQDSKRGGACRMGYARSAEVFCLDVSGVWKWKHGRNLPVQPLPYFFGALRPDCVLPPGGGPVEVKAVKVPSQSDVALVTSSGVTPFQQRACKLVWDFIESFRRKPK